MVDCMIDHKSAIFEGRSGLPAETYIQLHILGYLVLISLRKYEFVFMTSSILQKKFRSHMMKGSLY